MKYGPVTDPEALREQTYRDQRQAVQDPRALPGGFEGNLRDGRLPLLALLLAEHPVRGRVLELGAGSCWVAAELSKRPEVTEIVALDASRHWLENVAPEVIARVGGHPAKIFRLLGDWSALDRFPPGHFSHIFCSAVLHHLDRPVPLLDRCRTLLAPGGILCALREPVWPSREEAVPLSRRQQTPEQREGITENTYTWREWTGIFRSAGFRLRPVLAFPRKSWCSLPLRDVTRLYHRLMSGILAPWLAQLEPLLPAPLRNHLYLGTFTAVPLPYSPTPRRNP